MTLWRTLMGIWDLLGIERTTDEKAIKRAYAQKLKIYHPEDDPEGFLRLRSAYQQALEDAKWPEETADEETWRPVATFDPPFDEKPESAEPMWSDDYFIEDFTVIYADFFMRVDVKCWGTILRA
jgi:hypothetical protein